MPAILLPTKVHRESLSTKSQEFRNQQKEYIDNNQSEKAFAMQLIDQHNKTVQYFSDTKKVISELHSDQKGLIKYLRAQNIITTHQHKFLKNVLTNIRLNRNIEIDNILFNQ